MGLEGGGAIDYPPWSPKFWHGMGAATWWQLLRQNHFRVTARPRFVWTVVSVSLISVVHSLARGLSGWWYRRRLAHGRLPEKPIFILGHWRSGTTLLHTLLSLDPRFVTPTFVQCFSPGSFLLTEPLLRRFGGWLLPRVRPMDAMPLGWDQPEEDEFALLNLGAPSPYRRIAFPNGAPPEPQALDLQALGPEAQRSWTAAFRFFCLRLQLRAGERRLVFKSPTHTARIAVLRQLFPGAQFIYIARNPYAVFHSTRRLWQALHYTQSLQLRLPANLDDYIINCFAVMRRAYRRDRSFLAPDQLCEVRYEDLIADPVKTLKGVYARLGLGSFEAVQEAVESYWQRWSDFPVNRFTFSGQEQGRLFAAWREYFLEYGYCYPSAEAVGTDADEL